MAENNVEKMRHSMAHIMASAIQQIWPNAQFGVGPSVDNGFYYDIYLPEYTISDKDLPKIEKKMREIVNKKYDFIKKELSLEDAKDWAMKSGQKFKIELLNDIEKFGTTIAKDIKNGKTNSENQQITLYSVGDFTDLCRGPHIENSGLAGAYKLLRVSGAYWRGDEKREQMQRIYGVAFETQDELNDYLRLLEEAKKRDHRKLGKELDLFTFSNLVGSGLPLFTPRGTILRECLASFSNQQREKYGFQKVWIPHITKTDLYKTSGHWAKFGDELFLVESQETSDNFVLKPMNCPHHTQIFASKTRSYKDLPQRYLETTTVYRDEKTGELGGLSRVRSITQDDSHIFCRPDQIEQEIDNLLSVADNTYSTFGLKLRVRLSYRDDCDSYLGDKKLWEKSQDMIKQAVVKNGIEYYEQEGEAAFYGPKIDFMAKDAIGREHQVATVQLDFVMPSRFGLSYIDSDGSEQVPIMIHNAVLGSIERFLSVFIEHTAGWFPFWCAPEQVRILTINDQTKEYVEEIKSVLSNVVLDTPIKYNELRFTIDDRNESLGKKIREAVKMKIPMQIIIGNKDLENREISIRTQTNETKIKFEELLNFIKKFN